MDTEKIKKNSFAAYSHIADGHRAQNHKKAAIHKGCVPLPEGVFMISR